MQYSLIPDIPDIFGIDVFQADFWVYLLIATLVYFDVFSKKHFYSISLCRKLKTK